jgi:hypothetical protein
MTPRARNVLFVLLGVAGLLAKPHYHGDGADLVHSYVGNLSVSFAIYFNARLVPWPPGRALLLSAACALVAVEAFELTNGFGVMSNTYDPLDLVANAVGVGLAVAVDAATAGSVRRGSHA